jgi:glycosyltransferase involved in cell wall biosynthesis
MVSLRRQLARRALERERPERPAPELLELGSSPAWRRPAQPAVSVIVPLFNDADVVTDALDSVARSTFGSWEIVVVDDASTDDSVGVVRDWIERNPDLRLRIVGHELNAGLSRARNTGAAGARGGLLLMLDSDNEIRPWGLARLVQALHEDPVAVFAYGLLEKFNHDEAAGLVSRFGWEPARLREGNYIDALALIRKPALEAAGGYSEDPRLALGLEDYDLWVRFAEAGEHGIYVRNFVGRYRAGHSSMVSVTSISFTDARAAIAEHAPNLMRGVQIA